MTEQGFAFRQLPPTGRQISFITGSESMLAHGFSFRRVATREAAPSSWNDGVTVVPETALSVAAAVCKHKVTENVP